MPKKTKKSSDSTPDNSFYADMEKNKIHSSACCSVASILWLGVFLFIIGLAIIWLFLGPLKKLNETPSSENRLPEFASTLPSIDQPATMYTVTLINSDITEMMRILDFKQMKEMTGSIHTDAIEIKGTYEKGFQFPLRILILPKVTKSGNVTVEVKDATISGIRMIPVVTQSMRDQLAQTLEDFIKTRFSGKISNLTLKEGELTATITPEVP